ncbi:hypothetical protein [Roseateles sp. BYS96W]|uniref:DUF3325 domain-containing protein n=1 Tax=Pelomonas nitida TaxID=3299027 RepID=A0ABW7G811_9BURK
MTGCAVLCALAAAWLIYRASSHQRLGPRLAGVRWRWAAGVLGALGWALPAGTLGVTAALALALSALMAGLAALPFADAAWQRWRSRHAV